MKRKLLFLTYCLLFPFVVMAQTTNGIGGGVYIKNGGKVVNCVINNNNANTGGAVAMEQGSTHDTGVPDPNDEHGSHIFSVVTPEARLINNTITANTATNIGGVYRVTITTTDSILDIYVMNNILYNDNGGETNIPEDRFSNTNMKGVNPNWNASFIPNKGSEAIDQGADGVDSVIYDYDIKGNVRYFCMSVDRGAYEYQDCEIRQGCPVFTDINAGYVKKTYGKFANPYANNGSTGSGNSARHLVISSQGNDPNTGGAIKLIPPGESKSVRLGDLSNGGNAESITYTFRIDPDYAILLLNFAIVLQQPGHSLKDQPSFQISVLDQQGKSIDACSDYYVQAKAGENGFVDKGSLIYRNWTNVGLDMTPYLGQNVKVRLTTKDCAFSAHYGYAYFTGSCIKKALAVESCNTQTISVSAPDGFASYQWIDQSDNSVLGTSKTLTYIPKTLTEKRTLACNVRSVTGCEFTLTTDATLHTSHTDYAYNVGCYNTVDFTNLTSITGYDDIKGGWWDFGDGHQEAFNLSNPQHIYDEPGTYDVTFYLADERCGCYDTITKTIDVIGTPSKTIDTTFCSDMTYVFNGKTYTETGEYTDTLHYTGDQCDTVYHLNVTVNPVRDSVINVSICDSELPYDFHGYRFKTGPYEYKTVTTKGCDSTVTLNLTVLPTYNDTLRRQICMGKTYRFKNQNLSRDTVVTDSSTTKLGCDSVTTLVLTVVDTVKEVVFMEICQGESYPFNGNNYSTTGRYPYLTKTNSADPCDSLVTLDLTVWDKPITTLYDTICSGGSLDFNGQTLDKSGSYTAVLSTIHGCDSTIYMNLTVLTPKAEITTTKDVLCTATESFTLSAVGTYDAYLWNTGETTQSISPAAAGSYTLTVTEQKCTNTTTINIPFFNLQVNAPSDVCINDDIKVQVTSDKAGNSYKYNWSNGSSSRDIRANETGLLTLTVSDNDNCTITANVMVHSLPTATHNFNQADYCANGADTATITGDAGVNLVDFDFNGLNGSGNQVYLTNKGSYTIVIIDENQCENTVDIVVEKCDCNICLTNAFTPDGDGVNDTYCPQACNDAGKAIGNGCIEESPQFTDVTLSVFTRWGRKVFETSHFPYEWNGQVDNDGAECLPGVYFCVLKYTCKDSKEEIVKQSSVTLIR